MRLSLNDTLSLAWRDGYRAAKTSDTSAIPGFLEDAEPEFEERSIRYAEAAIGHYGLADGTN